MRGNKWWQHFHFCVNYPLKHANLLINDTLPSKHKLKIFLRVISSNRKLHIFIFYTSLNFIVFLCTVHTVFMLNIDHGPLLHWSWLIYVFHFQSNNNNNNLWTYWLITVIWKLSLVPGANQSFKKCLPTRDNISSYIVHCTSNAW